MAELTFCFPDGVNLDKHSVALSDVADVLLQVFIYPLHGFGWAVVVPVHTHTLVKVLGDKGLTFVESLCRLVVVAVETLVHQGNILGLALIIIPFIIRINWASSFNSRIEKPGLPLGFMEFAFFADVGPLFFSPHFK